MSNPYPVPPRTPGPSPRPRVLIAAGYFDWFGGYQEIGLTRSLREYADVHVLACDRVSPIFSDGHLDSLSIPRRYQPGLHIEEGVPVLRLPARELRAMLWSNDAIRAVTAGNFDIIIQITPGQLLPLAASLAKTSARRFVVYGDNAAMYAALPPLLAKAKFTAFAASKGLLYRFINARADRVYGYTPHTAERLALFLNGKKMDLLPLAYDESTFYYSESIRREVRDEHGWADDDFVVIAPGKVQAQKRFDTLMDAAAGLRAKGHRVRLLLVGLDDGEASKSLREKQQADGQPEADTLLPFVSATELNRLFNGADLGIWPAMPAITIQQAMGTGLAVALPQNEFVSHLISSPLTGAYFPDRTELQANLSRMIDQFSVKRDSYGDRIARSQANNWLSNRSMALRLLSEA